MYGMVDSPMLVPITLMVLALAVATGSLTLTKAKISEPLRELLSRRSAWLGKLFSCPYCMSHWLSMAVVSAYGPLLSSGHYFLDLLVSALAVVAPAAIIIGVVNDLVFATNSDQRALADQLKQSAEREAQLRTGLERARTRLLEQGDLIRRLSAQQQADPAAAEEQPPPAEPDAQLRPAATYELPPRAVPDGKLRPVAADEQPAQPAKAGVLAHASADWEAH